MDKETLLAENLRCVCLCACCEQVARCSPKSISHFFLNLVRLSFSLFLIFQSLHSEETSDEISSVLFLLFLFHCIFSTCLMVILSGSSWSVHLPSFAEEKKRKRASQEGEKALQYKGKKKWRGKRCIGFETVFVFSLTLVYIVSWVIVSFFFFSERTVFNPFFFKDKRPVKKKKAMQSAFLGHNDSWCCGAESTHESWTFDFSCFFFLLVFSWCIVLYGHTTIFLFLLTQSSVIFFSFMWAVLPYTRFLDVVFVYCCHIASNKPAKAVVTATLRPSRLLCCFDSLLYCWLVCVCVCSSMRRLFEKADSFVNSKYIRWCFSTPVFLCLCCFR